MQVQARSGLVESESASTETDLAQVQIDELPGVSGSHQLQQIVATTPGMVTENDGLLHVRGVDDGVLYVIDGIPIMDRVDALTGISPDVNVIRSMNVMTGGIPAEFGGRSGAVVQIEEKTGLDSAWMGSVTAGAGSFDATEISSTIGGSITNKLGIFAAETFSRSHRFLDPPDPGNFNNRGGAGRAKWPTRLQTQQRRPPYSACFRTRHGHPRTEYRTARSCRVAATRRVSRQ
jgi:hypothetical protein